MMQQQGYYQPHLPAVGTNFNTNLPLNQNVHAPPLFQKAPPKQSKQQQHSVKQTRPNAATLASITLRHLISANLIPPGLRTFSVGTIHNIQATLMRDGTIQYDGATYAHPSAFAVAVTRKFRNSARMSANGWLETSITDCFHAPTKLSSIRQWYKDNILKNLPPQPLPEYQDQFAQPPSQVWPQQPPITNPQYGGYAQQPASQQQQHIHMQAPSYYKRQLHPMTTTTTAAGGGGGGASRSFF